MIKVSRLNGIIKILDWLEGDEVYYIVMELADEVKDLAHYSFEHGALAENTIKNFFRQIMESVKKIHDAGVVHRDIKKENILVDLNTGELTLIDFGAATLLNDSEYNTSNG